MSVAGFRAFSLKRGKQLGGYCNYSGDHGEGDEKWLDTAHILEVQLTLEQRKSLGVPTLPTENSWMTFDSSKAQSPFPRDPVGGWFQNPHRCQNPRVRNPGILRSSCILIEKRLHINGLVKFEPVMFKLQN